jgi:hypothetical protein
MQHLLLNLKLLKMQHLLLNLKLLKMQHLLLNLKVQKDLLKNLQKMAAIS